MANRLRRKHSVSLVIRKMWIESQERPCLTWVRKVIVKLTKQMVGTAQTLHSLCGTPGNSELWANPPHCLHLALLPLLRSYWPHSSYALINGPPSRSERDYFSPQCPGFTQALEATGHMTVKCRKKLMRVCLGLSFPTLMRSMSQTKEWYRPFSGWVFPYQLMWSRQSLPETLSPGESWLTRINNWNSSSQWACMIKVSHTRVLTCHNKAHHFV